MGTFGLLSALKVSLQNRDERFILGNSHERDDRSDEKSDWLVRCARDTKNGFWRATFENSALDLSNSQKTLRLRDHGVQHDRADEKEAFFAKKKKKKKKKKS